MTRRATALQPYLRHIHLPSDATQAAYPSYCVAAAIQARLQRAQLDFKAAASYSSPSSSSSPPPSPAVVTFTPTPTYTLGRRQHSSSSSSSASSTASSSSHSKPHTLPPSLQALTKPLHLTHHPTTTTPYEPVVLRTSRGGLTTYHGPGQLVIWPVLDLKGGSFHRPFTVRSYATLLQTVTSTVLARLWGLVGTTTCDPGVWLTTAAGTTKETRKVAAMGVHLRRHVTGLGVALNLSTPVTSSSPPANSRADAEGSNSNNNPWLRFVPCGLEGKHVTSVAEELRLLRGGDDDRVAPDPVDPVDAGRAVADAWAAEFAACISVEEEEALAVVTADDDEVRQLVADVADEARLIEEESQLWPVARPDAQEELLLHPGDTC